jgi:hypothetical protein
LPLALAGHTDAAPVFASAAKQSSIATLIDVAHPWVA